MKNLPPEQQDLFDDGFDYVRRYPSIPGYSAPGTSKEAAESMEPIADTIRRQILDCYRANGPMRPDKCAEILNISILTVRPRCTELRRMGKLFQTGLREMNESGKMADVLTTEPISGAMHSGRFIHNAPQ